MGSVGNLGDYQRFTTIAKKVGGPTPLLAIISGASMAVGGAIVGAGVDLFHKQKQKKAVTKEKEPHYYTVSVSATDDQGLSLKTGDRFRVIERDKDAILIDIANRDDNPFFVSADFLSGISDFSESNI